MSKDELKALLIDNLDIRASFNGYGHGANELEIQIVFDGEIVASADVTVDAEPRRRY